MKPTINDYQLWLGEHYNNLIQIYDSHQKPIPKTKFSAAAIAANFDGDIMKIFENIKTKYPHLNSIYIQKLQKYGSGTRNRQELVPYNIIDNRLDPSASMPNPTMPIDKDVRATSPAPLPQYQAPAPQVPMGGLAGSMGLSMPQIMDMHTATKQLPKVEQDLADAKAKVKELEADNKKLERDNLRYELGIEGKAGSFDKLLDMFAENPESLASIIESFAKKGAQPGLSQAATNSEMKNSFIAQISKPEYTDLITQYAYTVAKAMVQGDATLKTLIDNHFKSAQ